PSVTATSGCLLLSLSASPLLSWAASPPYEVIGKLFLLFSFSKDDGEIRRCALASCFSCFLIFLLVLWWLKYGIMIAFFEAEMYG
ncbi:MAG: hypothetical protein IKR48_10630, partial [Kiritimatiellae bacterium]|nr:hypothetical protein [Kiritimatiellia bacterium]